MQLKLTIILASLFLLLLGCGKEQTTDTTDSARETAVAEVPGITFITPHYMPQESDIVTDFEKRFRTKVTVKVMSPRDIVLGAQDNTLVGDVVLLPTLEDAVRLKNFGRLQPFYVDAFSQGSVDDVYQDQEGYYAGLTRWTMAAVYDPTSVAVDEVSSYVGLAKLQARGIKVGMAHPDSSGLAATVAGLAKVVNPEAAQLWVQVLMSYQNGIPTGSDYDQMDRLLAGDIQVAFVSSGAAARWILNGDPTHFAAGDSWRVKYPRTEADKVNFLNMTCVGMLGNAPNRALALRFINHLFQKEAQEVLSNAYFEYPNEAFSEINQYILGVPDTPGRRVSANTLEDYITPAWEMVNRVANSLQ
jgi:ABC-type Fe3+ transport system substrate-binding protein